MTKEYKNFIDVYTKSFDEYVSNLKLRFNNSIKDIETAINSSNKQDLYDNLDVLHFGDFCSIYRNILQWDENQPLKRYVDMMNPDDYSSWYRDIETVLENECKEHQNI